MTPTKSCNRNSALGAVKRMSTDSDDLDWPTSQRNTPEVDDGADVLSSLLLSLILKLEDREYRVKDQTPSQITLSADESSYHSRQKRVDKFDNVGALVTREDFAQCDYSTDSNTEDTETVDEDVDYDIVTESRSDGSQVLNDPTHPNYNQIKLRDTATGKPSSGLSRVRSNVSDDMLPPSTRTLEDDYTLRSPCKQDQGSAYRDSAEHIVGDAMLRAIANIFTNGVIRRGVRTYSITVWNLTDYRSTHVTISDGYVGQPLIPLSEGMRQIKQKPDLVSSEWLYEVNRRIAAPEVTTVSHPDSMPPSVASSCNVSRCSSVDILSCGDRALKVKAIPPSQSSLLWRMVQKSHGSNIKKPTDEPDFPMYVPVNDGLTKEKKVELSEALERVKKSTPRTRFWGEKSTEVDRLVKFRDSTAQTEKKDFQKDYKSRDDDVIDTKEMISEAKSPPYSVQTDEQVTNEVATAQTNQEPALQMKQLNVPPIASPLLMDVVWQHASDNDITNQEKRNFKAHFARGGVHETEQAKGVVESAVHRAVSAVFVDRVISDSLESLTSLSELRITPSFTKAAADLAKGPPLHFEWFPYLEGSAGPCKVTDRRRQRVDRTDEVKRQPQLKGSGESSDIYEDAREKFGSSDDLLTHDITGQVHSSDDEFTDAVCESDCTECQVNTKKTIDKATQVSHTAYGKDSSGSPSDDIEDEPKSPVVQLELPMESINYIKDQFNDVKVLVAQYRELLYEPLDESAPVESQAQPQTKPGERQTSDLREVNTWQNKPGFDETDEDGDDVVARKPKRKHTKVEKEMKKAGGKSTKIDKQSEKLTKDEVHAQADEDRKTDGKLKEKAVKGKKENKESFPAVQETAFATQGVVDKDEDNPESTDKQNADQPPKVKDKRKKRDASPTRDKTSFRRTLRKTGDKMRTPIGRQRFGKTVLEKTTRDGFLPMNVKIEPENSLESEQKTGTTKLLKGGTISSRETGEKASTSSKPSVEDKPKVKNRISFFEKFSKHSLKKSDQTRTLSNSPSPEPDTPVKRAVHKVGKLERLSGSESTNQNFTHQSDEVKRKGKDSSKKDVEVNPESGVDSTPGKGIWTNRAFFEALGECDDQTVQTSMKPPKTAKRILDDGLLDEPGNEDGKPGPSFKTKREISRREKSPTSPEKAHEKSKSTSSRKKKKSRNKNTNNEALTDQVTTDDSCISSSQCSYTETRVDANSKTAVDRLLSSEITNCDTDTISEAKTTETSHDSRRDEYERTLQMTKNNPKLSSEGLNIDDSVTTENRCVSRSPCSDSKIKSEKDAVLLNNITPHQLSSEKVNGDETTNTESRCGSSSPCSDTKIEIEEDAFLLQEITPHQQHSSESLNTCKAKLSDSNCIPKSQRNHLEMENEENALKSKDIISDQKPSSGSLPHTDGLCTSSNQSHFQMDDSQDDANADNMKENILKTSQSTESVTEYKPQITEIKRNYDLTTDQDNDGVVLQSQNHYRHIDQAISAELTKEESKATSADDLIVDLSLVDDLSQEVQIHSPPPTGELDDVSSLNSLDDPLLTSSPHPRRQLKKSNTSLVESFDKDEIPDQTPHDDVNEGDEESGDDFLHHLRNTSFLMACNPDCYTSKDKPIHDVEINKDVDERKTLDEQEKRKSNRSTENLQSQSEIQQDGVNIFQVSAQPKSEPCTDVCQAMTSGEEQEAILEPEREPCGEQKSCLRFSLFRRSKKRSPSKNISRGQSDGQHQYSDADCIPKDETCTASKVEKEDAVAMVTKECTTEDVDISTDSNPTPPGSHKRKFRLKYLWKSKKHKASSKT